MGEALNEYFPSVFIKEDIVIRECKETLDILVGFES